MRDFIMHYWGQTILVALVGYILGSVNFSIIVTKKLNNNADIRNMGSGNAGFTNVLRSVGKSAAIITFLGDISKSATAIFLGRLIFGLNKSVNIPYFYVFQCGAYVAGVFCVIGHIYPCFFKFRGGKGVLTLFAMIFFIDIRVFGILLAVFLISLLFTRIVSLSSIVVAVCFPVVTLIIGLLFDCSVGDDAVSIDYIVATALIAFFMSMLVLYRHMSNIKRLIKGEEKRIFLKKK